MYRLFVIAKNNIKRQKGDMITFFILTFLTALLIFDCASVIAGLDSVLDDRFNATNAAHVMLINFDTEGEITGAERAIKENSHITQYERTQVMKFTTEFRKKGDEKFSVYPFYAEKIGEEKEIMKVETPDIDYGKYDIVIPYHLKSTYAIGDVMQLKFNDDIYDFTVAGYLEDPYFCSTMNITAYYVSLTGEALDKLADRYPLIVRKGWSHKGIADESRFGKNYDTSTLEAEVAEKYKEYIAAYAETDPETDYTDYLLINRDFMKGGSAFFPQVVMSIILIFAILILIISLVIMSFSIKNFIRRNMKSIGILEASGYTVRELKATLILQITLVASCGAIAGIVLGAVTFGRFGDIVSSVLGMSWNQSANIVVAILTFTGIIAVMMLVSIKLSGTYGKISVLDALRGGINTHNYKKNHFPLEKTPLPVPIVLSLKDTFGGPGRNIAMAFISALLVISTLIGFGMVENFGNDPDGLVKMMAFEMCTDWIQKGTSGDISDGLRTVDGVDNVLTMVGFEPTISYADRTQMNFVYAVDDMDNTRFTRVLEGRYPVTENEVMLTQGMVNDLGVKIGDIVTIEYAGKKAEFLVTGINQRMERMGRTIYMLISGARKLIPGDITTAYQYYVTAKDGISYDELKRSIDRFAENEGITLLHTDEYSTMESTITTVTDSLNAICLIIVALTVVIVVFVESLVIRAKISREWRGMGISKAIGQTTGGLITQIMLSNIPAILFGALIGGLASPVVGSSLIKAVFSLFAFKKVEFSVRYLDIFLTMAGIVLIAILTSAIAGLRVKRLKPVEMITEE